METQVRQTQRALLDLRSSFDGKPSSPRSPDASPRYMLGASPAAFAEDAAYFRPRQTDTRVRAHGSKYMLDVKLAQLTGTKGEACFGLSVSPK